MNAEMSANSLFEMAQTPTPMARASLRSPSHAPAPTSAFDASLARVSSSEESQLVGAREVAAQFVSSAFIAPILATLRSDVFQSEGPFATNIVEERFGPMYDSLLGDRIASAARLPLTEQIAQRLVGRATAAPEAQGAQINLVG